MPHRSRLGGFIIDCESGDLDAAASFWGAALGSRVSAATEDPLYRNLDHQGGLYCAVQVVDHPSRVHLDIETDDKEAEARRLTRLGAREVARIKGWIVMEAPTGHRFCLVDPELGFDQNANTFEEGA